MEQSFLEDFNLGKFIAYICLILFVYIFALKLDGDISWSYWIVFLPIWVYNVIVILGAFIGSIVWCLNPHCRNDFESYIQYIAMIITSFLHFLLLMFELLFCDQLQNKNHFWSLVFLPLFFASIISIPICVWSFHRNKTFELPLFCGINCIQFVFLALKLDNFVQWNWTFVFIPSWVIECLSIIGVVSLVILTFSLIKSLQLIHMVRKNLFSAGVYFLILIPIIIFQVLLIGKLNDETKVKHTYIVFPLILSIVLMLSLTFSSKPQNPWWFGLRKDVCSYILQAFPALSLYLNISYSCRKQPPSENNNSRLINNPRSFVDDFLPLGAGVYSPTYTHNTNPLLMRAISAGPATSHVYDPSEALINNTSDTNIVNHETSLLSTTSINADNANPMKTVQPQKPGNVGPYGLQPSSITSTFYSATSVSDNNQETSSSMENVLLSRNTNENSTILMHNNNSLNSDPPKTINKEICFLPARWQNKKYSHPKLKLNIFKPQLDAKSYPNFQQHIENYSPIIPSSHICLFSPD